MVSFFSLDKSAIDPIQPPHVSYDLLYFPMASRFSTRSIIIPGAPLRLLGQGHDFGLAVETESRWTSAVFLASS